MGQNQGQWVKLGLGTTLAGILISSCSSPIIPSATLPQAGSTTSQPAPASEVSASDGENLALNSPTASAPKALPQLVKTAAVSLVVDSVESSIQGVRQITQQSQGDLMGLQDETSTDAIDRQRASMQIRVPQEKLDSTLQKLKQLGTIQSQTLTAEDVSDQLVDFEARLRNLRKTEETLLKIMERSGEVADVLKVAQELSGVRNSIEQTAAQIKSLQNRVAYSTVTINLEAAIASPTSERSVANQLQETWQDVSRSLGQFTTNLMQLGIWLLLYSPYLLLITGGGVLFYRWRRSRPVRGGLATLPTPLSSPDNEQSH
ncbi:MAG: DUF4349 domain-containing protein [Microcoleaceae cyanobacterium]